MISLSYPVAYFLRVEWGSKATASHEWATSFSRSSAVRLTVLSVPSRSSLHDNPTTCKVVHKKDLTRSGISHLLRRKTEIQTKQWLLLSLPLAQLSSHLKELLAWSKFSVVIPSSCSANRPSQKGKPQRWFSPWSRLDRPGKISYSSRIFVFQNSGIFLFQRTRRGEILRERPTMLNNDVP